MQSKIFARSASFFLMLALAAGVASMPVMALAQDPAPATQPAADSSKPADPQIGSNSETKSEQKAEAKETDVYRHSKTVEWFANLMHLPVDQAADIFDWLNFAIIALAVGIPLIKVIPKVLKQRKAKLSLEIEVAKAKTADANTRLNAVEARMAGLDAEITKIRKQVEDDMRQDEARSKALMEEEGARIVAAAEQEIAQAGAQAQRGLKEFAADLAIDRAMTKLTLDAATDRALIAEFAEEIAHGGKSHAKGGHR